MTLTKREKIIWKHLTECRRKLFVERRVTKEFQRTRSILQRNFTKVTDTLKADISKLNGQAMVEQGLVRIMRAELTKRGSERDQLRSEVERLKNELAHEIALHKLISVDVLVAQRDQWREVAGMLANTVKQYQCSMFQPDTETYGNAVDALAAYERMAKEKVK